MMKRYVLRILLGRAIEHVNATAVHEGLAHAEGVKDRTGNIRNDESEITH